MKFTVTMLLSGLISFPALATLVEEFEVEFKDPGYELDIKVIVDAPPAAVFAVITDYENLHRLDERIESSRILGEIEAGGLLVNVRLRGCVVFFCRTLEKVESIDEVPGERVTTHALPERSDFNHVFQEWRLEPLAPNRTELSYRLEMEFKEPVPRLLRNGVMKRTLRKATLDTMENVERLAREQASL